MPKIAKELSAVEVRRINAPGFHAVGGVPGLLLQVTDTGARSWVLRVRVGSKRRGFGLGSFPAVGLAAARKKAEVMREQVWQGMDPAADRRAQKQAIKTAQMKALTFAEAAKRMHAVRQAEFSNAKHRKDWLSSLERHAFQVLGDLPVADVETAHVLQALEPIWETRTETATRVRQRIETVINWAISSGLRTGANPAQWKGHLKNLLPAPTKIAKSGNQPALPWQLVPEFMRALRAREGMGARALEFAILTAARSGEVRGAMWKEIDLAARVWTVPKERMKARDAHTVPLSDAAVALLESLPRVAGNDLIFPAVNGGTLSDMTLSAVTRRMHADAAKDGGCWVDPNSDNKVIVPHGFRSSFKDWARNQSGFADEVSELALAHVNSDATRAAYARDGLLPQRSKLMARWAKYCEQVPTGGAVVEIGRKAQ
jgi:integrase